jgi:TolB-like protein/DNA-binding winged helix-turn-helix (wHTH) protein/Flp pilus assembly protein TadD
VGEWTVDRDLGLIRRSGEAVVLEPRVMDLLVFLADRAGDTVSTDELAATVWAGRAVSNQPVYQGIAQLRKALGDDARDPRYVATVTKKGYRLIAPVNRIAGRNTSAATSPATGTRRAVLASVFALLLAASFLFLASSDVSVLPERGQQPPVTFESIAVLPFIDMSEDGSQQYLGDGLAEELIHRIAAIPGIRVVARTSSFVFRDGRTDVQAIGAKLGAEVILEGSVRRSGDRLRITAQLINTRNGYHLWSQSYEPATSDAFAVQDQIAASVAQLLRTADVVAALPSRSWTHSGDAADAYYLGLFHMHKRRADSLQQSIDYFRLSLEYDSNFALAHLGLSQAYFLASEERFGKMPDVQSRAHASTAMQSALLLDDSLAEAYMVQAILADSFERTEAQALRALEINPNLAGVYVPYVIALTAMGRHGEALEVSRQAVKLDPLSPVLRVNLAASYRMLNRMPEARAELETAIELDPGWHVSYFRLAQSTPVDQHVRRIELLREAMKVEGPEARFAGQAALAIGHSFFESGDYRAAENWFARAAAAGADDWLLANHKLHWLLAKDRFDEADRLLTRWAEQQPALADIFSLGGLYRSMMLQDAAALAMFEHAESLHADGSNLLIRDFLQWGYVPAVHYSRLCRLAGDVERAEQLLWQSEEYLAGVEKISPGLAGSLYVRASIAAEKNDRSGTFRFLRAAVENGWSALWYLERDPIFHDLRTDVEFLAIVALLERRLSEIRASSLSAADPASLTPHQQ